MKATGIQVMNVACFDEYSIGFGQRTRISGGNGTGKSTLIKAVQATLSGGGFPARMARVNKDGTVLEPQFVLVLDDGRIRIERTGDKTEVKQRVGSSAAYEKVARPQTFLDQLYDHDALNPVSLLTAKPDEWAEMILRAVPLEMAPDAIEKLLAEHGIALRSLPGLVVVPTLHPLQQIALVRQAVYDTRTGVNVSQMDKERGAYELQKSLPAAMPEDPSAAIAQAEKAVVQTQSDIARAEEQIASKERAAIEAAESDFALADQTARAHHKGAVRDLKAAQDKKAAEMRAAVERAIEEKRLAMDAAISGLQEATNIQLDEIESARDERVSEARAAKVSADGALFSRRSALMKDREQLAGLRASKESLIGLLTTKEMADRFEAEAGALKEQADRLTATLKALDTFKKKLASDLPLGLEISGKTVTVSGIGIDQINRAQQIRIAVAIAALRAKKRSLPIICVDNAEALDAEQLVLLEKEIVAQGCQGFLSMVTEGALKVEAMA